MGVPCFCALCRNVGITNLSRDSIIPNCMPTIHPGRFTTRIEGPFVVFLIGFRINRLLAINKWLPDAPKKSGAQCSRSYSPTHPSACSAPIHPSTGPESWSPSTGAASNISSTTPSPETPPTFLRGRPSTKASAPADTVGHLAETCQVGRERSVRGRSSCKHAPLRPGRRRHPRTRDRPPPRRPHPHATAQHLSSSQQATAYWPPIGGSAYALLGVLIQHWSDLVNSPAR